LAVVFGCGSLIALLKLDFALLAGFLCIGGFMALIGLAAVGWTNGFMDEVWCGDDRILVKNGKSEESIAFGQIENVDFSNWRGPPRVIVTLREHGTFGKEFEFIPRLQLVVPMSGPRVANELLARIRKWRGVSGPRE
jgi:hypothetical protein